MEFSCMEGSWVKDSKLMKATPLIKDSESRAFHLSNSSRCSTSRLEIPGKDGAAWLAPQFGEVAHH